MPNKRTDRDSTPDQVTPEQSARAGDAPKEERQFIVQDAASAGRARRYRERQKTLAGYQLARIHYSGRKDPLTHEELAVIGQALQVGLARAKAAGKEINFGSHLFLRANELNKADFLATSSDGSTVSVNISNIEISNKVEDVVAHDNSIVYCSGKYFKIELDGKSIKAKLINGLPSQKSFRYNINFWKPGEDLLPRELKEGLKEEELRAQIKAKVDELSGQPLAHLWNALVSQKPASEPKPIPTEPPDGQLYANRPSKTENAPAFIQRVYGPWLDGNFTRADLRRIDAKAEMGLRNWERDHKQRADINLPTIKEKNDALLAAGIIVTDDPMETARRAAAVANRARRNTK